MVLRQSLIETMPVKVLILEDTKGKTPGIGMRAKALLTAADEINGNGRVYPEKTTDREMDKIKKDLSERATFGEVDHSEDGKPRIRNTAAILTDIEKVNENGRKLYYGYFDVLETSLGKDLQTIIRAGGKVGVSSRSLGSTENGEWQGKPAEIVQEDLNIKAFDFVIGQSTKDAVVTEFTEQMQVVNLVETGPCPGCPNRPNETQEAKRSQLTEQQKRDRRIAGLE
jgi:hypothetical protein